ncbi:uncharacterized protein M421DRAFT_427142 [Didymella exigua CBS 183.55]|uniref:Uncharacterized protein n=1 Tax=Didymella exigua CBS 183.55 TaxID=1150837 RepID=A0A6A5R3L1_9PLEO|nr:uncharacterized protein M421DRAFT_427142 [Didymella exigua CBS 183.55]KAF1922232.1 hypothetical protein M421DRAFT_427142 [Didymella exigua CBS 183.55]
MPQDPSTKSHEDQILPFKINPIGIDGSKSSPQNTTTAVPSGSTLSTHDRRTDLYIPLLAASYRNSDDDLDIPSTTPEYLAFELNVDRLNAIHKRLWAVGRPMPPRALHHQRVLGREIVLTERMDMHLVWSGSRIFLKPIPRYLLEAKFWADHLSCKDKCYASHSMQRQIDEPGFCETQRLRRCALGFLVSYAALISYESDFHIARENNLLPKEVEWLSWKTFVKEILQVRPIYTHVNKRFVYGELRLNRLNTMYRLGRGLVRGYHSGYSQYGTFFQANFTWLASLLAYVVIILAAMQVGLGTTVLQESEEFQTASYGFTIFAIVGPLAAVALIFGVFLIAFVGNWVHTSNYERKRLSLINKVGKPA